MPRSLGSSWFLTLVVFCAFSFGAYHFYGVSQAYFAEREFARCMTRIEDAARSWSRREKIAFCNRRYNSSLANADRRGIYGPESMARIKLAMTTRPKF